MRRGAVGLAGLGTILAVALLLLSIPGSATPGAAQSDGAEATATRAAEEAELADLRTRVAILTTEVARLGGGEALAGRLGGSRAGFDVAYGPPAAFIGPDEVAYEVRDVGRVTATFADDHAERLVIAPPRPPQKPTTEPDPADWTIDEARETAARFVPEDATLGANEAGVEGERALTGSSAELATILAPAEESGCPPTEDRGAFGVTFTMPTDATVSAITLALAPAALGARVTTPTPAEEGRASRGGSAVANSSLGGTVTVNGIRVEASRVRSDAESTAPPAPDSTYVAVQVAIENQTDDPLRYDLPDFVLTDAEGREVAAVCGGVEPPITRGELAPGEAVDGWITFQVPADFDPQRFVFLVDNARVGFLLD